MNIVFKILIIFGICSILFFSLPNSSYVCKPRDSNNGIFSKQNIPILIPNFIITFFFGIIIPTLLLFSKDVKENFKKRRKKKEERRKKKEERRKKN